MAYHKRCKNLSLPDTNNQDMTVRYKCLNCNEPIKVEMGYCDFPCEQAYKTRIFKLFNEQYKPTLRSLD